MPEVSITCKNPACPGPSDVIATYRHAHGVVSKTWTAPAVGPTPDGTPHPAPCPNDQVSCPAVSVKCNTCGWTKQY